MFEKFYPDEYMSSTYKIPFEQYYEEGYRGVLFDVDNTLVPHGAPADKQAKEFFQGLHKIGYKVCLMSNNKEPRVKSFCEAVGVEHYLFKANKPAISGYQKAMERLGTDTSNTLFVGDQIFTDVFGAKRAGIKSILVEPIHPKEEIQIVLKRYLEKLVLREYEKNKKNKKK